VWPIWFFAVGDIVLLWPIWFVADMSHYHNFTKMSAVMSVITVEQSAVILNNMRMQQPNRMHNFFNKTKRIDSNHESECSTIHMCSKAAAAQLCNLCREFTISDHSTDSQLTSNLLANFSVMP